MESCMFHAYLTVLTRQFSAWQWIQIWKHHCASKRLQTLVCITQNWETPSIHSDRGSQYTSKEYREVISLYGIRQSMNSDGGRCHDNARCESMWARMKEELFYGRIRTENYTVEELKEMVWRYFMSFWNNRRICTANGGLPPMVKRQKYYASIENAA